MRLLTLKQLQLSLMHRDDIADVLLIASSCLPVADDDVNASPVEEAAATARSIGSNVEQLRKYLFTCASWSV